MPRSRHRACHKAGGPSDASGTSSEKPSKIHQKSIKIIAKMVQNRGLEGVLAALGRLLGGSWLQGTSGGLKMTILPGFGGVLGGVLAASLGRTGGVLGGFRASLGAFWAVLGAS